MKGSIFRSFNFRPPILDFTYPSFYNQVPPFPVLILPSLSPLPRSLSHRISVFHLSAIVAVLGFLGCLGALKKYRWLLIVYAFVVFCVLAMQIAAGTYVFLKREKVKRSLTTELKNGVNINYGKPDAASKALTYAIDWFQRNIQCCGSNGPEDWKNSAWRSETKTGEVVPRTCCRVQYTNCNVGIDINSTSIYHDGCVEEGKKFASENIWLLGVIGVAVGAIEVFGVVTSLCLCKVFYNENRVEAF